MNPRPFHRLSIALAVVGLVLLLIAGATFLGWTNNLGSIASFSGYGGQLRLELGTAAGGSPSAPPPTFTTTVVVFRPHPWSVQAFRSRGGVVAEIGAAPLAGLGLALLVTPLVVRRLPRTRRGLCPHCRYDLRGQLPTTHVCPECGNALEPGIAAPPTKPA